MLRVPISLAAPGMKLAAPVRHPRRPDHTLLQIGYTLDEFALSRLQQMKVPELWIRYPGLDFISKFISPAVLEGQARLTSTLADVFDVTSRSLHAKLDFPAYKNVVTELLETLLENPQASIFLQDMASSDQPLLAHCSNVCFISLLMGMKLEGYVVNQRRRLPANRAKNLVSLGMAGLLHDIGMQRLDAAALQRWTTTGDETDRDFRRHAAIGYDLIKGSVEPSAAAAVLHHHQRWDGTGFPEQPNEDGTVTGLRGEKIHIFARILAAADIFDRLRTPPGAPKPLPVVAALHAIQDPEHARKLDPFTLRALLAVVPPYPPGGLVTLSNGVTGVVTEWRPEDPCRVVVRSLGDLKSGSSSAGDERTFDLRDDQSLHVASVDGVDVRPFNFYPTSETTYGLADLDRGYAWSGHEAAA